MPPKRIIKYVRKRSGAIQEFQPAKIKRAILKAVRAAKTHDGEKSKKVAAIVIETLEKTAPGQIPRVEEIQDIVEQSLIGSNLPKAAKAFILYREEKTKQREMKKFFGVWDDLKLGVNAIKVLEQRYLLKDAEGKVVETPSGMFRRAAKAVARAERKYKNGNRRKYEKLFYEMMARREFLPNSPTLMNAGAPLGQLSACFVLPVPDDLGGIFDALKNMAVIHKSGGGTGFSFSQLRPAGSIVGTTKGMASGPVSFMKIFDAATEVIRQGGRRRGANMGILKIDHPDILDFITAKTKEGALTNFNLSVTVTNKFMQAVQKGSFYWVIDPHTKERVQKLKAGDVFDLIIASAWKTGDPGLVFIDEINQKNPTRQIEEIESTNPCGEQPLGAYESCNLGSINLAKIAEKKKINWKKLANLTKLGVRFLDNVIDVNKFPIPEIEKKTKANRRIGLGVMGFAEALLLLGIPYDSEKGVKMAEKIMEFIRDEARKYSKQLGKERGSFPNLRESEWKKKGYHSMRNATLTTIAPTGTISIIAGCSSGIEPLFAVSFVRNVMEGTKLLEVNKEFEALAKEKRFVSGELFMKIARQGSVQGVKEVPKNVQRIFKTALDINYKWHVRMQAAFQKYTDNAVSKTINFPALASPKDIRSTYLLAWKLKCKGITVYRYGSKPEQVLTIGPMEKVPDIKHVSAESEFAGGCPATVCPF